MDGFLYWGGWQGVAGIAQILAASLAAYAVWQARAMLRQADDSRKDSVAPDWDIVSSHSDRARLVDGTMRVNTSVDLLNTGFGPARSVTYRYEARNGHNANISAVGNRGNGKVIAPGDLLLINLDWDKGKTLDGALHVYCRTRFGYPISAEFRLKTYVDEDAAGRIDFLRTADVPQESKD